MTSPTLPTVPTVCYPTGEHEWSAVAYLAQHATEAEARAAAAEFLGPYQAGQRDMWDAIVGTLEQLSAAERVPGGLVRHYELADVAELVRARVGRP